MKVIFRNKFFALFTVLVLGFVFGISGATTIREIHEKENIVSEESKIMDGKVLTSVKICNDEILSGNCKTPTEYDEAVRKVVKKYGGETLGAKITYKNETETVYVILAKAGKYLNNGKSFFFTDDRLPILINKNSNLKLGDKLYATYGEYSSDETPYYIMMDDSMTVMNFLFTNKFVMQYYEPLAIFDDEKSAYDFYKNESSENFEIKQIFNSSITAKKNLDSAIKTTIGTILSIILISIFVIFIFGAVVHKKEKKIVSIYRMFGATKFDIFRIYLNSGILIFIASILFAAIIGIITFLIIS